MDFIGQIVREPDPPGIDKKRWFALIGRHPNLALPEPKEGVYPFTKKPMILKPRSDVARIIVDGEDVGTMYWSMDDSNLINVSGDPQVVIPLAHEIAGSLGGRFHEFTSEEG
jgi:hypothetical protein